MPIVFKAKFLVVESTDDAHCLVLNTTKDTDHPFYQWCSKKILGLKLKDGDHGDIDCTLYKDSRQGYALSIFMENTTLRGNMDVPERYKRKTRTPTPEPTEFKDDDIPF